MLIVITILEVLALAVLSRYLWRKHLERIDLQLRTTLPADWKGTGFDAAPLRPRLEAVRRDYTAVASTPRDEAVRKPRLLCLARKMICDLAYFHDRPASEPEPAHTGQS